MKKELVLVRDASMSCNENFNERSSHTYVVLYIQVFQFKLGGNSKVINLCPEGPPLNSSKLRN